MRVTDFGRPHHLLALKHHGGDRSRERKKGTKCRDYPLFAPRSYLSLRLDHHTSDGASRTRWDSSSASHSLSSTLIIVSYKIPADPRLTQYARFTNHPLRTRRRVTDFVSRSRNMSWDFHWRERRGRDIVTSCASTLRSANEADDKEETSLSPFYFHSSRGLAYYLRL